MKPHHLNQLTARLSRRAHVACVLSAFALALVSGVSSAQEAIDQAPPMDHSERVYRFDLSGPRIGGTFAPDGSAMSQFGWHFESQASPSPRGPWFIVEKVILIGGVDQNRFVPNGTLIFGMRLPSSFEFGLGPSLTLDATGFQSGIVAAVGHSYRFGGIRVPVNVACAWRHGGEPRWSVVTGWAIRDLVGFPSPAPVPAPVDTQ